MEWGGATIGWQATSSLYQQHPLSVRKSADVGCKYSSSRSAIVYRVDSKYSVTFKHTLSMLYILQHVIMMSLMNVTMEIGLLKVISVMVSTVVETTETNRTVI